MVSDERELYDAQGHVVGKVTDVFDASGHQTGVQHTALNDAGDVIGTNFTPLSAEEQAEIAAARTADAERQAASRRAADARRAAAKAEWDSLPPEEKQRRLAAAAAEKRRKMLPMAITAAVVLFFVAVGVFYNLAVQRGEQLKQQSARTFNLRKAKALSAETVGMPTPKYADPSWKDAVATGGYIYVPLANFDKPWSTDKDTNLTNLKIAMLECFALSSIGDFGADNGIYLDYSLQGTELSGKYWASRGPEGKPVFSGKILGVYVDEAGILQGLICTMPPR